MSKLFPSTDFVFIDVETTGIDAEVDKIVEIAMVRQVGGKSTVFHTLVNPEVPIPPGASAVHHITDEMLVDAPTMAEIAPKLREFIAGLTPAAHNAKFDKAFVDRALYGAENEVPWLCTYRLARHIWPEAPAYGNQVLRYWKKTQPQTAGLGAHRAIDDVYVSLETMKLLFADCEKRELHSLDAIREHAATPIITHVMPFGKHKDKEFKDIPTDYFEWALKNMADLDNDLKLSMDAEMQARGQLFKGARAGGAAPLMPATSLGFGKYANQPLANVPSDYFEFLLNKGIRIKDAERAGIDAELARRLAEKAQPAVANEAEAVPTVASWRNRVRVG